MDRNKLEETEMQIYLSMIITRDGRNEAEITARTGKYG